MKALTIALLVLFGGCKDKTQSSTDAMANSESAIRLYAPIAVKFPTWRTEGNITILSVTIDVEGVPNPIRERFDVSPNNESRPEDAIFILYTCTNPTAKITYSVTLEGNSEAIDPKKASAAGETSCTDESKIALIAPTLVKNGELYGVEAEAVLQKR